MVLHLTSRYLNTACAEISALFREYAEWLFVSEGSAYALRRDEIELSVVHERLVLSCWTEQGTRLWHVLAWEWNGQLLGFEVSRRLGAELSRIELIPRTSAKAIAVTIRAARQLRCERLAQLAAALEPGLTIERLALSRGTKPGQPGRYAQILLRTRHERICA